MVDLLVKGFPPLKQKAITLTASGKNARAIAKEIGVNESTLYAWRADPDFTDAAAELASQTIDYALMDLVASYREILQEILLIGLDTEKDDADRLRALNMACQRVELFKSDKNARDVRLLTRLLQNQPTNDNDLYRESQERIQAKEASQSRLETTTKEASSE